MYHVVVAVAEEPPPPELYPVGGDTILPIDSLQGPARDYTPIDQVKSSHCNVDYSQQGLSRDHTPLDQVNVVTVLSMIANRVQPGTTRR
jgi:predicted alpha/beta superfamily hydrolase